MVKALVSRSFKRNDFIEYENHYVMIVISKGKAIEVLIDKDDYELVKDFKWFNCKNYIQTKNNNKQVKLHRFIMNCPDDKIVDHINRNTFDNRKENLRITNHYVNARNTSISKNNTSGVKGVSYDKRRNKWIGHITGNKKSYSKRFNTKEDAIFWRKSMEVEVWGGVC